MKRMSLNDIVGYGSRVFVYCEKDGRDSDETKIEIDFSKSSFPEITIEAFDGKIRINTHGSIEQGEILEAFRSVVKILES